MLVELVVFYATIGAFWAVLLLIVSEPRLPVWLRTFGLALGGFCLAGGLRLLYRLWSLS